MKEQSRCRLTQTQRKAKLTGMANPNPSPATRFKPGQSGNPSGKSAAQARRDMQSADMASKFRHALLSSVQEKLKAGADPLEIISPDIIRVMKDSEDRAHGTPKAAVDHTSSDGTMSPKPALDVSKLSHAARAEILAAYDADSGND
jgi:hypothetical protein